MVGQSVRWRGSNLLLAWAGLQSTHAVVFLLFVNDFRAQIIIFNLLLFQFVIFILRQMLLCDLEVCLLVVIKIIVEALVFIENSSVFHIHLIVFIIIDCVHRNSKFSLAGLLSEDLIPLLKPILLLGLARDSPIQLFGAGLIMFRKLFSDMIVLLLIFLVRFVFGVLIVTRL